MGPVAAIAVGCALASVVTLLPALLLVLGRWVFWPAIPAYGTADPAARGMWAALGGRLARRPRAAWLATVAVLVALASGLLGLTADGINTDNAFVTPPDSVVGARVLAAHFPAGAGEPVVVVTTPTRAAAVHDALAGAAGVAAIAPPAGSGEHVLIDVTLDEAADTRPAQDHVRRLRDLAHGVDPHALVGGQTATLIDTNDAAAHDRNRIVPLVLLVVLAILVVLLRSIVAPLMLVATVVLSFAAALGTSALLFNQVMHWHGADSSLPLFVFVFLVALGVDYNIFLATRIREEAVAGGDTRVAARTALAATGGVITSAGLVLAGTFAALASLPLIAYAEIGVAVAVGVLMDTTLVRAVLVTALTLDLGRWTWWPGRLAHRGPPSPSARKASCYRRTDNKASFLASRPAEHEEVWRETRAMAARRGSHCAKAAETRLRRPGTTTGRRPSACQRRGRHRFRLHGRRHQPTRPRRRAVVRRGAHEAGAAGQDVDAGRAPLVPEALGQDPQVGLGRGVVRHHGGALQARHGAHEDDPAAAAGEHGATEGVAQLGRRPAVEVHHRVQVGRCQVVERADRIQGGVHHQQADLLRGGGDRLDAGRGAGVGRERPCPYIVDALQPGGEGLEGSRAPGHQHDVEAAGRQRVGEGGPDPVGGADDRGPRTVPLLCRDGLLHRDVL
jgi:hypothetical protein